MEKNEKWKWKKNDVKNQKKEKSENFKNYL